MVPEKNESAKGVESTSIKAHSTNETGTLSDHGDNLTQTGHGLKRRRRLLMAALATLNGGTLARSALSLHRPDEWPEVLSVAQVAELLSVGRQAVVAGIERGDLSGVAIGVHAVRDLFGNCAAVTGSPAVFLIVSSRVFVLPGESEVKAGGQEVSTVVQAGGGVSQDFGQRLVID